MILISSPDSLSTFLLSPPFTFRLLSWCSYELVVCSSSSSSSSSSPSEDDEPDAAEDSASLSSSTGRSVRVYQVPVQWTLLFPTNSELNVCFKVRGEGCVCRAVEIFSAVVQHAQRAGRSARHYLEYRTPIFDNWPIRLVDVVPNACPGDMQQHAFTRTFGKSCVSITSILVPFPAFGRTVPDQNFTDSSGIVVSSISSCLGGAGEALAEGQRQGKPIGPSTLSRDVVVWSVFIISTTTNNI